MRTRKERDLEIWEEYTKGKSQKDLALDYEMTQGRISQILKPFKKQEQQQEEENTNDHSDS